MFIFINVPRRAAAQHPASQLIARRRNSPAKFTPSYRGASLFAATHRPDRLGASHSFLHFPRLHIYAPRLGASRCRAPYCVALHHTSHNLKGHKHEPDFPDVR